MASKKNGNYLFDVRPRPKRFIFLRIPLTPRGFWSAAALLPLFRLGARWHTGQK
jgi:hypothetical protein